MNKYRNDVKDDPRGCFGSIASNNAEVRGKGNNKVKVREVMSKRLLKFLLVLTILASTLSFMPAGAYAAWNVTAAPNAPNTDTQIILNWAPVLTNDAGTYYVYSCDVNNNILAVLKVNNNDGTVLNPCTFTDIGLTPATTYYYMVAAYSGVDNNSTLRSSQYVSATTSAMLAPSGITSHYDMDTNQVTLSWTKNSNALITGTNIYRGTTVSDSALLATAPGAASTCSFTDPQLNAGGTAQYTIVSYTGTGSSTGLMGQVSPPLTTSITAAVAPTITVTVQNGISTVTWGTYPNIQEFTLQRQKWDDVSSTWGSWADVKTLLTGTYSTDVPPSGGAYRYRLNPKAGSSLSGASNYSQVAYIPKAPTGLTATAATQNSVLLTWTDDQYNESDLQVKRMQTNGTYVTIATLNDTAASYIDNVSLASGTSYTYKITAYDSATNYSDSAPTSVSTSVPVAPTGLYATVSTSSAITLNWIDNSNNETAFVIERKNSSGSYTVLANTLPNANTYTDSTVVQGQNYTYRVKAHIAFGDSGYSNEVTVAAADYIMPSNLTVTAASSTQIDLAWMYAGSSSYRTAIERRTGSGGPWTLIYTTNTGVLKYSDYGLTPNTQYFYRVSNSPSAGVTTVPYPNDGIGKGTSTLLGNLTLSGSPSSGNTTYLTWSGAVSGTDVIIERKMANGSFAAIATVNSAATGWSDTSGLVPGAVYTYRIKAKTSSNESIYSNEVQILNYYLIPPYGLIASVNSSSGIDLTWYDNSTDETGFELYRSTYGTGNYTLYTTLDKNTTKYTDNSVQAGIQYYYMIRAVSTTYGAYSGYSNTASAGIGMVTPPSNLKASFVSSSQVLLTWTDNSTDESGFKIEEKIGDGDWNIYGYSGANTTSYNVSGLNQYTQYYFRIRAYNYTGNADSVSDEVAVSTALPAAPSGLTAAPISSGQVNLSWKDNSGNETGFRILRTTQTLSYYTTVAVVGAGITSYSDKGLSAGVTYSYKVEAYNGAGIADSTATSATTFKKSTFKDVTSKISWAQDAIESLAGRGIITGSAPNLFKPYDKVTKAQFVSMVLRAFNLETNPVGSFADVKVNKWYYKDVMSAENLGIVSGDSKNMFYPNKAITREEMAVIVFKAAEAAGKPLPGHENAVLEKFSDRSLISPNALSSFASLVGEGIFSGISDTVLGPRSTSNRAEAAVVIYRVLDR